MSVPPTTYTCSFQPRRRRRAGCLQQQPDAVSSVPGVPLGPARPGRQDGKVTNPNRRRPDRDCRALQCAGIGSNNDTEWLTQPLD
jgi:hypothetical protein